MGNGFHQSIIQGEGIFHQFFSIAGGCAAHNAQLGIDRVNLLQHLPHQLHRPSIAQHIFAVENFIVLADDHQLDCRGTRVNPHSGSPLISRQLSLRNHCFGVSLLKLLIFAFIGKQGRQAAVVLLQSSSMLHAVRQGQKIHRLLTGRIQRSAVSHIILGIFRKNAGLIIQLQHIHKAFL